MLYADFNRVPSGEIELVTPFASRPVTHAFHDIDGTHSLIREWVPVMTLCTGAIAENGCSPDDTLETLLARIGAHSPDEFPEAHRFSVESAGLSALTQMEWALRCAIVRGKLTLPGTTQALCEECVRRIWSGIEEFDDIEETPGFRAAIAALSERLFRAYEVLLLKMGRDRNLEAARKDPEAWRVPGSMAFLDYLRRCGVKNYFVTGAVVEYDAAGNPLGTMAEEVRTLGYEMGPGKLAEALEGSTWQEKLPKNRIMEALCRRLGVLPSQVLVVGDGRSEIAAGASMGALCISRLPKEAVRQREIHRKLGTNLIVERYDVPLLSAFLLEKEQPCPTSSE